MGCHHGNAIYECPDLRCQGGSNGMADYSADQAAGFYAELSALRAKVAELTEERDAARRELIELKGGWNG